MVVDVVERRQVMEVDRIKIPTLNYVRHMVPFMVAMPSFQNRIHFKGGKWTIPYVGLILFSLGKLKRISMIFFCGLSSMERYVLNCM